LGFIGTILQKKTKKNKQYKLQDIYLIIKEDSALVKYAEQTGRDLESQREFNIISLKN
jgi:hypothetical protein